MFLIIAAAIFVSSLDEDITPASQVTPASADVAQPQAMNAARKWIVLLDQRRWENSWNSASALFRTHISATQWVLDVRSVRLPLGAVSIRHLASVTAATSLPGAPPGRYEVIEFRTAFAHKDDAVETIILAYEASGWKVAGYFIR